MKKEIWLIIILAVIIVVLAGVLLWPSNKLSDIKITSPKINEEVSSPIKITGVVNGNGWAGLKGRWEQ